MSNGWLAIEPLVGSREGELPAPNGPFLSRDIFRTPGMQGLLVVFQIKQSASRDAAMETSRDEIGSAGNIPMR
jgi:hypothetical protein